ncbi:MAG: DegV family protein [Eggerthellaceae bacterium]|jgi:DegV family protein with EDD domain|nr:DegV family protein [Eggerthellaceae bacterium]MCH4221186.1 DegV family protein [Eggerthellaceae bacterium]
MLQIITDSTTDIPAELRASYDVNVLPLVITIDGTSYLDGIDISIDRVYEAMRQGIVPVTAQIPFKEAYRVFRECLEAGNDVLYISFSSKMSGCAQLAQMVLDQLKPDYPARRMLVIDSCGGSAATGLIVLQALHMASAGADIDDIASEVRYMTQHVQHIFSIADLKWMVQGGRIAKPLGYVGSVLNIHPWLDVEQGSMVVKGMVRGRKKAIEAVARETIRRASAFPDQLIAITHADDCKAAQAIETKIHEGLPQCRTAICEIGAVLGVHLGRGGVGVFFFDQRSPHYAL